MPHSAVTIISIVDCAQSTADDLRRLVKASNHIEDARIFHSLPQALINEISKLVIDKPFECSSKKLAELDIRSIASKLDATHLILQSVHEDVLRNFRGDKTELFASILEYAELKVANFCGQSNRQVRIAALTMPLELDVLGTSWRDRKSNTQEKISSLKIEFNGDFQSRQSAASNEILIRQVDSELQLPNRMGWLYNFIGDPITAAAYFRQLEESAQASVEEVWFARYCLLQQQWRRGGLDQNLFQQFGALFDYFPDRAEPLLPMSEYLRGIDEVHQALELLDLASDIPVPKGSDYSHDDVYQKHLYAEQAECHALLGNHRKVYNLCSKQLTASKNHVNMRRLVELRDIAYAGLRPVYPTNRQRRNHFLIIVPFFNATEFIQQCIDSIASQEYRDYEVVFVDDVSTDGGMDKMDLSGLANYRIVVNTRQYDGLGNQTRVMDAHPEPNDIAILLDGDDGLAHPDVLSFLNQLYNDSGCWMTYGQHSILGYPESKGAMRPTIEPEQLPNLFNGKGAPFSFPIHLRTNRVGLFQRIKDQSENYQCLRGEDGELIAYSGDIASARAMMQLAGHARFRYVPETLCIYNTGNPISHHHIAPEKQTEVAKMVAAMDDLQQIETYLPNNAGTTAKTRLMIICLASGDPKTIDALLAQGKLPNIARLLPHKKNIQVRQGMSNDSFWRAVYSGKLPGEHFMVNRDLMRLMSYRMDDMQRDSWAGTVQPFWDEFADDGCQVAALNVPEQKRNTTSNVTSLSEWLVHGQYWSPESQPKELLDTLRAHFKTESGENDSFEQKHIATPDDFEKVSVEIDRRQEIKASAYTTLLQRGDWDIFVCGFDSCHDYGHRFWHFHDPEHPDYQPLLGGDPIEKAYLALDKDIGALLDASKGAPAVLVAGLGFQKNPSLNTILPEILRRIETTYEVGYEVDTESLADPNSPHTKLFYTVSTNPNVGGVNLNVQGREAAGIVKPHEFQVLVDRLIADLMALKSTESGKPMLQAVVETARDFPGPYAERLPDLFLIWNHETPRETFYSDLIGGGSFQADPDSVLDFRTGDHDLSAGIQYNDALLNCFGDEDAINCEDLSSSFKRFIENSLSQ